MYRCTATVCQIDPFHLPNTSNAESGLHRSEQIPSEVFLSRTTSPERVRRYARGFAISLVQRQVTDCLARSCRLPAVFSGPLWKFDYLHVRLRKFEYRFVLGP